MTLTLNMTDILLAISLITVVFGFITWMFKMWKEFNALKIGMGYRQDDMVMIFRCLRVLLETSLDKHNEEHEPLDVTLTELNRYIETRAAGLNTRNKPT